MSETSKAALREALDRLVNRRELRKLIPVSDMTMWRWIKAGIFPAPQKINNRNYWRLSQVREVIFASSPKPGVAGSEDDSAPPQEGCSVSADNKVARTREAEWKTREAERDRLATASGSEALGLVRQLPASDLARIHTLLAVPDALYRFVDLLKAERETSEASQ